MMVHELFPDEPEKRGKNPPKERVYSVPFDMQFVINVLRQAEEWPANAMCVEFGMSKDRFIQTLRSHQASLVKKMAPCPGCTPPVDQRGHTCCPYQMHAVGHCNCSERWDYEVPV